MNQNTLKSGVGLLCLSATLMFVLTGCSGTPSRDPSGVVGAAKPPPDLNNLVVKPGQNKVLAVKHAFNNSMPR